MSAQAEFACEARREEVRQASAAMIERIKKLLRLGADKRGNPHEAERAMQLAFELAEKHRVDVAGLDLDDEAAEKVMHERWEMGMRFDRLRRGIAGILQSYFHVHLVIDAPGLIVIGKATDVLIARYVHDFLLRAGRNCLRAYETGERLARRRTSTAKRANYVRGFIWGISAKLNGARTAAPLGDALGALVVAEDRERQRYQDGLGRTQTVKALGDARRHDAAIMAGVAAGRATQIHQPLGDTRRQTLQLA